MTIKVLVVDDSNFFCRRVAEILNADPEIKVVGVANNGQEAIQKTQQLKPDVVTLDVEMPVMDGITALKPIIQVPNVKVLMLSSLTYEGARSTLDALEAGASDFLLKSYEGVSQASGQLALSLRDKVKALGKAKPVMRAVPKTPQPVEQKQAGFVPRKNFYQLLAIGASTGGPVALQQILTTLPKSFPIPITITQHMPGTFTGAFAQRLNGLCALNVMEAAHDMIVKPGNVYIAPGGKQMIVDGAPNHAKIKIRDTDTRLKYAPSVDVTFASAAKVFSRNVLALVLTGMGADGRDGARLLKQVGATVWTQDESSSVVWGMPMSVKKAGFSDLELSLDRVSEFIMRTA